MGTAVNFDNVSKRYRLGLTRSSIPSLVSGWFKSRVNQGNGISADSDLWALREVSFELEQGTSLGLIGPNGSGKTTILKLLANITRPTSGSLTVDGKLSALIELGAGFHPDLTGRENIFLNGAILGLSRAEIRQRFDEILEFAELDRFIDTPVKRYSSGMVVRLGFAVASCIEPDVLLVDEVLAVGDATFQQKCLNRIQSLIESGTSIIFVSHNLYSVQAACDFALYLRNGCAKYYGPTKDVLDRYEWDIHQQRALNSGQADRVVPAENDPVAITRVDVSGDGTDTDYSFYSDQCAKIQIHYTSHRTLGAVQASAFIYRSDGVLSCMMRTKLDEFDLKIEEGHGIVEIRIEPLQLVGGSYYVEASLLDESDSMNIASRTVRSDWFSVKGKALGHSETSVFEPNTQWVHYQNGDLPPGGS